MAKKKRAQGEWSFTQRKDKLWTARKQFGYKANGKPNIKAFYGKNITEVKQKAKEYEIALATNRGEEIKKVTLYEYLINWLKTYKSLSIKSTTYDAIEDAIEVRIKPYAIANVQLHMLSTQLCQEYINELVMSNKKYSLATITKTYNTINACLRHAEGIGDIEKNPMAYVQLPSEDKVQTATKDVKFFTQEESKLICAQAVKQWKNGVPKYYYGDIIILLMYTGMRIGECLGLKWKDIDFENNTINIDNTIAMVVNRDENQTKKTKITDTSPKTKKSIRKIPMAKKAREALLRFQSLTKEYVAEDNYIVVSKHGEIGDIRNVRRSFTSILEGCGLKEKNINNGYSLHSLRHTFVSTLLAKGVDIKVISDLVGHEKVSTTYNIYAHLIPEQKEQSIMLLDEDDEESETSA